MRGMCFVLSFCGFLILLSSVNALGLTSEFDIYLKNKKGMEALEAGDLEKARKNFGEAQVLDPEKPELDFNQGVAELQAGDVDRAIHLFQRSMQENRKFQLLGQAYYNLGWAFQKQKKIPQAVQAYLKAIEWAKQNKSQTLENAARKNLQLLLQLPSQPEKEKNADSKSDSKEDQEKATEKGDPKKSERKQSNSESSPEPQKEKMESLEERVKREEKEKKEQGFSEKKQESLEKKEEIKKTDEKNKKPDFISEKMNIEDAERVLSDLREREKELQKRWEMRQRKKQTRNGKVIQKLQKSQMKDW